MILDIGTLNVRGIQTVEQRKDLARDMIKYNLDICCLSETHIPESQFNEFIVVEGSSKFSFYSANADKNSHHGVGFIVNRIKPHIQKDRQPYLHHQNL